MSYININSNLTKKDIIEKIKYIIQNEYNDIFLIPEPGSICNSIFSADVFRRNGHNVSINKTMDYTNNHIITYIYISKNTVVINKQVTRDDCLEDLKFFCIPYDKHVINIKACGTAIKIAWEYCNFLSESCGWIYQDTNISAIPVKINDKNIFKTTLQFKLVRFGMNPTNDVIDSTEII
jgi:hypothetical protein